MINLEVLFSKVKKNTKIQIKCGSLFIIRKDILCHLFFEYNIIQMLAATTLQVVHSEAPIFHDSFEHCILSQFQFQFFYKFRKFTPKFRKFSLEFQCFSPNFENFHQISKIFPKFQKFSRNLEIFPPNFENVPKISKRMDHLRRSCGQHLNIIFKI